MKTILDLIDIHEGRKPLMHAVTTEWMQKAYKKFNKLYFDNELPECELEATPREKMGKANWLGQFGFQEQWGCYRNKTRNGQYIMYYDKKVTSSNGSGWHWEEVEVSKLNSITELRPKIQMSQRYEATWDQLEDTLIHEMIHYWTYLKGLAPKQAHGPQFRKKCDEIREKARLRGKDYELEIYARRKDNYQLTAEEQAKEVEKLKRKENNSVLLYFEYDETKIAGTGRCSGYTKRFGVYTKKNVDSIISEIKHYDNNSVKVIYELSKTAYKKLFDKFGTFKTCRTYRFWDATEGSYKWVQELAQTDKNKKVLYEATN